MLKKISKMPFRGTPEQAEKLQAVIDESKNDNICYVLKSEDLASALALKVTLFEADKPALKPEEVTAEIKAILKGVNALTFAFEVALMIEKKDQDNVQKKLSITNRFIEALAEILR